MNNKLYHSFCVYSYKGGELSSHLNVTLENLISEFIDCVDWEDMKDICADDEEFAHMDDEKYFSLSCTQLVDMMNDKTIECILSKIIYPGNIYAFDTHSDYEIYTINDEGKLVIVNIINEPDFLELSRKALRESAESWDNYI